MTIDRPSATLLLLALFLLPTVPLCGCKQNSAKAVKVDLEIRRSILAVEKQIECETFSPCFYSSVDGALDRNPDKALRACKHAVQTLPTIDIPYSLPPDARSALETFRDRQLQNAKAFLGTAQVITSGKSEFSENSSTCEAYGGINRLNKDYDLQRLMRGKYIDCAARL
jgi:hypothetical protein